MVYPRDVKLAFDTPGTQHFKLVDAHRFCPDCRYPPALLFVVELVPNLIAQTHFVCVSTTRPNSMG
jgi:hypothetical protein